MNARRDRFAITTGDQNGVGLEVTLKALTRLRSQNSEFLVFGREGLASSQMIQKILKIKPNWLSVNSPSDLVEILRQPDSKKVEKRAQSTRNHLNKLPKLHFISLDDSNSASWFALCVDHYKALGLNGIITGPVSKQSFAKHQDGLMGHTGLMRDRFPKNDLFQGYIGSKLAVVLATDHVPVAQLESTLSDRLIRSAVLASQQLCSVLPKMRQSLPIAVMGLNPHASEGGMIGDFDVKMTQTVLKNFEPSQVIGPIAADSAFTQENRKKHSVYLCLYHDQGLIPFKTLHGMSEGFQMTLGVPFVRTSVDHGTATELFGKNKADPGSMLAAIQGAIRIAKGQK